MRRQTPGREAGVHALSVTVPDDLVSEIAGRFTGEIDRLDLARVRRIAATLTRNVERDIRRSLKARWAEEAQRSDEAMDEVSHAPGAEIILNLPDGVDSDLATDLLIERLQAWIGDDAHVVVAIAIVGESSHEVAARLGIDAAAVRQRYGRALRRLSEEIEK